MKTLHVITTLSQGGAEAFLYRLVSVTAPECETVVLSLMDEGVYGSQLRALGVRVETLGLARGRLTLPALKKAWRVIKDARPDVVQTWMYHSDLIGGCLARAAGVRRVYWGIHNSTFEGGARNALTRLVARLCAILSNWAPAKIACCSRKAGEIHKALGYKENKFVIIPNGYDPACFAPDDAGREELRRNWNVRPDECLLGMVARWHPQKDHENLFEALALLGRDGVRPRCALVGPEMTSDNAALVAMIRRYGLEDRLLLLGPRSDIPAVMNALDVHILCSSAEAFPNVICEAMSCGTPCVVTDVGDAAFIVDDCGWVAPPKNPRALADAIRQSLAAIATAGREPLAERCRARIVDNFSLARAAEAYLKLWRSPIH